jgi:hypothetical protein
LHYPNPSSDFKIVGFIRFLRRRSHARLSTKEQTFDLQVDALKKAACTKVYTEIMSGIRAERPDLLENLRAGDVLVVWKLDRLGRSLKHLIEVVNELMTRKIGLKSINDPIDTTTPRPYVLTVDATIFLISHSAAVINHAKEHRDVLL